MADFVCGLHKHLALYKQGPMKILEAGIWVGNGKAYDHVLPVAKREHNILEPIRAAFWEYADQSGLRARLHRDFHHLSSSQALAFNLFFTFFGLRWSEPAILLDALRMSDKRVASFAFESVPDEEEATNFDFFASFTDGTRLLVEVKLSESDFGKCKNDAEHQLKRDTVYRSRLAGKVQQGAVDSDTFFSQYQLMRNVSHLREGDALVLLLPRANRSTFAHAERFVRDVVTDVARPAVHVIALEDLLNTMSQASTGPQTANMISQLTEKYVVAPAV